MEAVHTTLDNLTKLGQEIKAKFWGNRTNRITLLFVLAAILISLFFWHQFARRHYYFSATSQRDHIQQLKSKLQEIKILNKTLQFLQNVDSQQVTQPQFTSKLQEFGITKISHEQELLANCSKQFYFDQQQVTAAQSFIIALEGSKH